MPVHSLVFCRYGSDLMAVESYAENNLTASLATMSVPLERRGSNHYWLGLASLDDLRTNTLESAAGTLVSQYSGKSVNLTIGLHTARNKSRCLGKSTRLLMVLKTLASVGVRSFNAVFVMRKNQQANKLTLLS